MNGLIYAFINRLNHKVYVGQTVNLRRRIALHRADLKRYNTHFYNAVRKYGWENFQLTELSSGVRTKVELDNLERLWIILLQATDRTCGYNILPGGDSVGVYNTGKPKSPEHRAKLAAHLKQVRDRMKAEGRKPSGRPRGSKTSEEGLVNIRTERRQRYALTKMSAEQRRKIHAERERARRARLRGVRLCNTTQ